MKHLKWSGCKPMSTSCVLGNAHSVISQVTSRLTKNTMLLPEPWSPLGPIETERGGSKHPDGLSVF